MKGTPSEEERADETEANNPAASLDLLGQGDLAPGWAWAGPKQLALHFVSPGGLLVLAPLLVLVPWGWVLTSITLFFLSSSTRVCTPPSRTSIPTHLT